MCQCTSAHWRHRMQLLAFGVVSSRTSYFRDPWNWMDAAIVALICIDSYQDIIWFIEQNSAYRSSINVPPGIKVLRALRALRPLRWVLLRYQTHIPSRIAAMRVVCSQHCVLCAHRVALPCWPRFELQAAQRNG